MAARRVRWRITRAAPTAPVPLWRDGSGKTHLLHAVGTALWRVNRTPKWSICTRAFRSGHG
ncbi:hypothetical protein ACL655_07000 [Klebsiella quasipneumoniae subsp. similipneumoniae]